MGFSLTIISGPEEGRDFSFERVQITLGRTIDNDIVLPDPGISRQHFSIRDKGGAFIIKDLGSSNGTMLNGKKIKEEVITAGDMITAGGAKIRFDGPTGSGGEVSKGGGAKPKRVSARAGTRGRRRTARPSARRAQSARGRASARPSGRRRGKAEKASGGISIKSSGIRVKKKKPETADGAESIQTPAKEKGGLLPKIKFWVSSLDKKKKIMLFSAVGVVLLLIIFGLASGGTQIVQSLRWYDDVDLNPGEWAGDEPMSYGLGIAKRNCLYRAAFQFKYASGRATMTYMVAGTDQKQEVDILLNGVHIVYAPATLGVQWSEPKTLNLPRNHLLENQINKVEFINRINRDDPNAKEEWAVAVGEISEQPLPPANKSKALEAFANAAEKYKNKDVSPGNLYHAMEKYEEARDFMELMEKKPDEYIEATEMIKKINKELDKIYHQSTFKAEKYFRYHRNKDAKEVYRLLMLRFPNQHDPRNKAAKEAFVNLGGSLEEVN